MRTLVVTGGTDGIGAALVRRLLHDGDRVVVVGRSRAKFDRLVEAVSATGTPIGNRATFLGADLSLVAECRRVVGEIVANHDRIDGLVLAASYVRRHRHITAEGHEASWVLFFVSKYLLATGLAGPLAASDRPVVITTSVPGARADALDFGDPESLRHFSFARSNRQQRRANELLGITLSANPALSYVTWGPRWPVATSFAGEPGPGMRLGIALVRWIGVSPDAAVTSIAALIADPPVGRHAYRGARPVSPVIGPDDVADAARLVKVVTDSLVQQRDRCDSVQGEGAEGGAGRAG